MAFGAAIRCSENDAKLLLPGEFCARQLGGLASTTSYLSSETGLFRTVQLWICLKAMTLVELETVPD